MSKENQNTNVVDSLLKAALEVYEYGYDDKDEQAVQAALNTLFNSCRC